MSDWTLFVSPACPLCDEATAFLDASGLPYQRRRVLPASRPGMIRIERDDADPIEAPASVVPATPALWDVAQNRLYVGIEAIERYLAIPAGLEEAC